MLSGSRAQREWQTNDSRHLHATYTLQRTRSTHCGWESIHGQQHAAAIASQPVATQMVSTVHGRVVPGSVQHHSSSHTTATAADSHERFKPSDTGSVHSETPSRWQKTLNKLLPAQKSSELSSRTCRCGSSRAVTATARDAFLLPAGVSLSVEMILLSAVVYGGEDACSCRHKATADGGLVVMPLCGSSAWMQALQQPPQLLYVSQQRRPIVIVHAMSWPLCSVGICRWQGVPARQSSLCHAGHLDLFSGSSTDSTLGRLCLQQVLCACKRQPPSQQPAAALVAKRIASHS